MTYSTKSQPRTYDERVANARDMTEHITGDQLLLVDEMTPLPRNNPLWCSYGPAPNSMYLIAQSGMVVWADPWLNVGIIEGKINGLLGK